MLIVLGILAVSVLGGIIYVFTSPKSSRIQKLAALGAIIISGLTILVCGIILIFGGGGQSDPYSFPLAAETTSGAAEGSSRIGELIIFLVILLLIFGYIIYAGIREQKKNTQKKPDANKTALDKAVSAEVIDGDDNDDFDFNIDDDFDL